MKKDKHPESQKVIFQDTATGDQFLCLSTIKTRETGVFKEDGKEYPLYRISVSSKSHPYYLGENQLIDTEGRVKKFQDRYKKAQQATKQA
ncbi:MAG: ribosomal protein [Chlamydiales bacterium]|jgi:large subunit ribosomal protein L31|nr:ribosomal protein [Chlamydiales bacterium]